MALDIAKVLTTVGITVKIGDKVIEWAHDYGDLGGTPSGLDCTPLSALVHMEKSGVVEQEQWELSYYFNENDYDTLETAKTAGESKEITITFPGGVVFTNSGVVAANFLTGAQVNNIADAKAVINLSNAAGWVKSKATAGA